VVTGAQERRRLVAGIAVLRGGHVGQVGTTVTSKAVEFALYVFYAKRRPVSQGIGR
jgi:hypothetical protein